MFKKFFILSFLLCATVFLLNIHGAGSQDEIAIESSLSSSSGADGLVYRIRSEFSNVLSSVRTRVTNVVMNVVQPVLENVQSFVLRMLNAIFMSDDTRMTTSRSRRSIDSSSEENWSDSPSIMSLLSGAFIAPFKMTFAAVRDISFDSLYERVKVVLEPVNSVLATPAVQSFSNSSRIVFDSAVSNLWNFTKISVLPQINDAMTTLRNSNALPTRLNIYLGDLQSLYSICHTLGIM